MKDATKHIAKTVDRMLDRRAHLLFGVRWKDATQLQQDVCLFWLNLSLEGNPIVSRVERTAKKEKGPADRD